MFLVSFWHALYWCVVVLRALCLFLILFFSFFLSTIFDLNFHYVFILYSFLTSPASRAVSLFPSLFFTFFPFFFVPLVSLHFHHLFLLQIRVLGYSIPPNYPCCPPCYTFSFLSSIISRFPFSITSLLHIPLLHHSLPRLFHSCLSLLFSWLHFLQLLSFFRFFFLSHFPLHHYCLSLPYTTHFLGYFTLSYPYCLLGFTFSRSFHMCTLSKPLYVFSLSFPPQMFPLIFLPSRLLNKRFRVTVRKFLLLFLR